MNDKQAGVGSPAENAGAMTEQRTEEAFSIFRGDGFDRALTSIGFHGRRLFGAFTRTCFLVAVTWVPLALLALVEDNLVAETPREAFLLDLASWAQFVGFIPFAVFAERYIGGKMQDAMPHLTEVSNPDTITELSHKATRRSRSWLPLVVCIVLGYWFSWLWAREEISNGLNSWHSVVATGGEEGLTWAGVWVAFVALPIFTFMWLRWVWKIVVWTWFLWDLSRRRLKLMAVHPDRTAGLGCLSDVQTSFSMILFGTGVLVSAFLAYKLTWEGTPLSDKTVWIPTTVYIFLAPGVFLAPLFLFTRDLRKTKHAALVSLNRLAVEVAHTFQEQWFTDPEGTGGRLLTTAQSSHLADLHAAYESVDQMRVVPFDHRSVIELFTFSAAPFAPLIFIGELPAKVQALLELFG